MNFYLNIGHVFCKTVAENNIGVTGQTMKIIIQRSDDNYYWTGTTWSSSLTKLDMTKKSDTDFKGVHIYAFIPTSLDTYTVTYEIESGDYAFNDSETWYCLRHDQPSAIETLALEYDFTTYSKAVILYYGEQRTFAGDPLYWAYIYTAVGGNPANVSEIAKRDQIIAWSSSEPT